MGKDKYRIVCRDRVLDLTGRPVIMGILNTTPDSFYDGGRFFCKEDANWIDRTVAKALAMEKEGAGIIDIGGESTRPGAERVDTEEELRRTIPVIHELRNRSDVLISIDTYKARVAEKALLAGAQIVNDISGFRFDPDIGEVCRQHHAAAILMHTTARPEHMQWSHQTPDATETPIMNRVMKELGAILNNAEKQGIDNIILDPGFGFGKSVAENYELLRSLDALHALERPLLAGVSRKSFLGKILQEEDSGTVPPPEKRLTATIAANTAAVLKGANILRVHDVREALETIAVAVSVQNGMSPAGSDT